MRFSGQAQGNSFTVREDAAHMLRTLRMGVGDRFTGLDGSGTDCECEITATDREGVYARIISRQPCPADPKADITLMQAYTKVNMELIVRKCTEAGVSRFLPFFSRRVIKRPEGAVAERLSKIAAEAVKQCGRNRRVPVEAPLSFGELVERLPDYDNVILCYEEERAATLHEVIRPGKTAVIIGPEGGFEPEEAERLIEAGARAVTLGKRILKAETAGLVAVSAIMYEFLEI